MLVIFFIYGFYVTYDFNFKTRMYQGISYVNTLNIEYKNVVYFIRLQINLHIFADFRKKISGTLILKFV